MAHLPINSDAANDLAGTECYRVLSNRNKEVRVQIAYNSKMALEAAKGAVREELKKKGDNLHEQLDKIMGF